MSTQSNTSPQPSMLSTMTMVHMGVEILIIAGLVYWIHSKNKETNEVIAALVERVSACEAIIEEQARHIENINKYLQAFSQQINTPPQDTTQRHQNPQQYPQKKPQQKPQKKQYYPEPQSQKSRTNISQTFETTEEEELDTLLEDEIEELSNCTDDGQCTLTGKKK